MLKLPKYLLLSFNVLFFLFFVVVFFVAQQEQWQEMFISSENVSKINARINNYSELNDLKRFAYKLLTYQESLDETLQSGVRFAKTAIFFFLLITGLNIYYLLTNHPTKE